MHFWVLPGELRRRRQISAWGAFQQAQKGNQTSARQMSAFRLRHASVHERETLQEHQEGKPTTDQILGEAFPWEAANICEDLALVGCSQCDAQKGQKVRFSKALQWIHSNTKHSFRFNSQLQTSKMGWPRDETRRKFRKNGTVLVHSVYAQTGDEEASLGLSVQRNFGQIHGQDQKKAEAKQDHLLVLCSWYDHRTTFGHSWRFQGKYHF